ncbi:hypothetical protein BpHYR1_001765 [Brachionus plicatilis]|uniref:Uncharacterized protein n=1 Tax=Brachionus plicatilis TaxID=10195 RepID=A0A3M7RHA1_BRAPC|nr:hypothetical protein BpHYR1_001765 [Brachionus plicatilis]
MINLFGNEIKVVEEITLLETILSINICKNTFKFESNNFNDINNFLEKYGLYAFQHRILDRMNSENLIEPTSKSILEASKNKMMIV